MGKDETVWYDSFGNRIVIPMTHVRTFERPDGSWWTHWRKGKKHFIQPAVFLG